MQPNPTPDHRPLATESTIEHLATELYTVSTMAQFYAGLKAVCNTQKLGNLFILVISNYCRTDI